MGAAAERYLYSDPNVCMYKLGMFGERLILEIFAFEHIAEPKNDNTHAVRIRLLKKEGLIPKKIDDILYVLRKTRNDAVHSGADSVDDAKTLIRLTYNLSVWFMEVYGDWGYIAPAFVMPEKEEIPDDVSVIKEQEETDVLSAKVETVKTEVSDKTSKERAEKAETASESMNLSEAETRLLIDEQLQKAGWGLILIICAIQREHALKKEKILRLPNGRQTLPQATEGLPIMRCLRDLNLSELLKQREQI